jgi:hypothetical protein
VKAEVRPASGEARHPLFSARRSCTTPPSSSKSSEGSLWRCTNSQNRDTINCSRASHLRPRLQPLLPLLLLQRAGIRLARSSPSSPPDGEVTLIRGERSSRSVRAEHQCIRRWNGRAEVQRLQNGM